MRLGSALRRRRRLRTGIVQGAYIVGAVAVIVLVLVAIAVFRTLQNTAFTSIQLAATRAAVYHRVERVQRRRPRARRRS